MGESYDYEVYIKDHPPAFYPANWANNLFTYLLDYIEQLESFDPTQYPSGKVNVHYRWREDDCQDWSPWRTEVIPFKPVLRFGEDHDYVYRESLQLNLALKSLSDG